MKSKKGPIVLFIIILSACGSGIKIKNDEKLIEQISTLIKSGEKSSLNFGQINSFTWDTVCILMPFQPSDSINDKLGFHWELSEAASDWLIDDGVSLIAFIKSNMVVNYVFFPRRAGDFTRLSKSSYAKENAIFEIKKSTDGDLPWYDIIEASR